jgi:ethanolamine-phosphate phospho-lyase
VKDAIKKFLISRYGLAFRIRKLAGHVDTNYLLSENNVPKFVLKLSKDLTIRPFLEAQHLIFEQLKVVENYAFPQVMADKDGKSISIFTDDDGSQYLARVLKYLPGKFLAESTKSDTLLKGFGSFLATMDQLLLHDHPLEIVSRHYEWDLQHFLEYADYLEYITDPAKRKIIEYFLLQFRENIQLFGHRFRKSIIHNDANDWNILSNEDKILGAIDFGDMVYSYTVNELAVGATYLALDTANPLERVSKILEGYHYHLPLEEIEVESIYYLIAARLCMSACQSARLKLVDPQNTYLSIHEIPVWTLLEKWISISPDLAANSFRQSCGFKSKPLKSREYYIGRRDRHLSKCLSLSYETPIIMERAAFQYMFDHKGKTYLDCVNNIIHVGHCHPHVVDAGQRQMARMNTNTRYFYNAIHDYAERILNRFPASLNKIFFVNSGSAASDLAIRLARTYTNKKDVIVMDHGYHGNTTTGIEISPYKFKGEGGKVAETYIHTALLPGSRVEYENSREDLLERIDHFMTYPVAAFICEPIVGCGGQVMLNEDYLMAIYGKVRNNGGVCIADEVQTGFGRVGTHFWAYEIYDVLPDIVVLGKPMGNGHPVGAVVTTEVVAEAFENGMEFFSSFGGNPVSCRIGESVLDVIEFESLQQNALAIGRNIMQGFKEIQKENDIITDVRGAGLFIGVELGQGGKPGTPVDQSAGEGISTGSREAHYIINEMKNRGILLSTDGPYKNVIKIKPPLCFNMDNVDQLLTLFRQVIEKI